MSPVVGLVGKKRVGKDSFAATLVEEFGWRRLAFADPLKRAMLDLNPLLPASAPDSDQIRLAKLVEVVGWECAKENREVRRLLQAHGLAIREHVGENVWVDAVVAQVIREDGPVVVTDVRFPNEADAIEEVGGLLVRIKRPDRPDDGDCHVSETALDRRLCGLHVLNGGTLEDLARAARSLVERLS